MTLSADSTPEDGNQDADKSGSGRQLEPSNGGSEVDASIGPFLAAAADERLDAAPGTRPLYSRLLDYSAHAAMIVGLLGFAWTVSDHVAKPTAPAPAAKVSAAAPAAPPVDEAAELRRSNQKMAADISALRLSLDALRGSMHQDKLADQVHSLASSLDSVKSGLNTTKAETSATLAQLSTKIDHLPHSEAASKIQQIAERLERMERQETDRTTTASIPPAAAMKPTPVALPPVKPASVKTSAQPEAVEPVKKASLEKTAPPEADMAKKPPIIAEWVVREVYDGVAVVESKRGPMEVVPGVTIPGAGVVRSIDRHGSGWTVTTSKGQIAYLAPSRDREQHGYYRTMPEDF